MPLCLPQPTNSAFDLVLQELPADYWALAYEFKTFPRGCKIQSSAHLLQVVRA